MKHIQALRILVITMTLFFMLKTEARSQETGSMVTIILTVTGYGAGAGALVGLASLAFGSEIKAVAQGASLGLYLGLLFGSYIVISHHYQFPGEQRQMMGGPYSREFASIGQREFAGEVLGFSHHRAIMDALSVKSSSGQIWQLNLLSLTF